MRPVRIEMEGFSAFRDRTEVDFDGVDLFAFVGATGAGKSSVIDALVFALYGSVPRYLDNRLVAPVITQGAAEARVRLDFLVGDDVYTAVRVVRRTKTGATTKEARLERGDVVLAGDAKAMTAAVEEVLGLSLEQFTTCVVLPQGEFARLLHDTPAARQDLLVRLLDLGLYERLAALARSRERAAAERAGLLDEQVAELGDATPEAAAEAAARVEVLAAVVTEVEAEAPELERLSGIVESSRAAEADLQRRRDVLGGVEIPDGVAALAAARTEAEADVAAADADERAAAAAVETADTARAELGDRAELVGWKDARHRLRELEASVAKGAGLVADAERDHPDVAARVSTAEQAVATTRADLDAARIANVAADLASHVHAGDNCPVCQRPLDADPKLDAPGLDEALAAETAAEAELRAAQTELAARDGELTKLRTLLEARQAEHDTVAGALASAPSAEEIEARLAAMAAADLVLEQARMTDRDARARRTATIAAFDIATAAARDAARTLTTTRDRLAGLGPLDRASDTDGAVPPEPEGRDLGDDWKELVSWAGNQAECVERLLGGITQQVAVADAERARRSTALRERCAEVGVTVTGEAFRDACVDALAGARADRERVEDLVARSAELRTQRDAARETEQVHQLLKQLLGAAGFEQWLLDEALGVLVAGASHWLDQLSSGAYALTLDVRGVDFCVIDHRNAGEVRLARTLSGGETFLASLALALALAERVSDLAATGAPRLEAIFLDEGFGTLDPETLDVVATAVEELGATGRMVGLVSHVRELAERVPVRFEVTKGPSSSRVERVER